jgi:hypothetical protein
LIRESWLLAATLWIVATQVGVVLTLVLRNAWVRWRLSRLKARSELLARLYDELGAETNPLMRGELAHRSLRADLATLEQWIDLVVQRGLDPAQLPAAVYEQSGLVERYLGELRGARRWTRRAAAAAFLGWTGSPRAVAALLNAALDLRQDRSHRRAALARRIRHQGGPAAGGHVASSETWFTPRAARCSCLGKPAVGLF